MKKLLMIVAVVVGMFTSAQAQTEKSYEPYQHWFVGLQGGAAMTVNGEYNNFKQITPTASFSVGWHPIKEFALRLNANGIWSKSGINYVSMPDDNYAYNYVNGDVDALINLVGIFGKKDWYPVNLYIVAGAGMTHMWDAAEAMEKYNAAPVASPFIYPEADPRNTFNACAGLLLDVSLCKHLSLNLEADYNAWMSNTTGKFVIDTKQLTAQIGLAYKFGYKKKTVAEEPEPYVAPTPAPAPKPAPAPVVEKKSEPAPAPAPKKLENMEENVFFSLGKWIAKAEEDKKVVAAAEWMKAHPSATAVVTGYADKGTGSAAINKKISEKRATAVADRLKSFGISADRLSVDSKGDTVQPFVENDKNRVVIIACQEK